MTPPLAGMLECRTVEELMTKFPKLSRNTAKTIITLAFDLTEEWKREYIDNRIGLARAISLSRLTARQQLLIFNDEKGIK